MNEKLVFEIGKIYYLDYGNNTQIIGRFSNETATNYYFYDLLHYWNGYETFRHKDQYCVKSGIENVRRASKAEIHSLVKHEIENDCL